MKKLMMALAVAFTGASVMAANVSWAVDCYDLSTDVSGWSVYAINGGGAGALANYLTSGNYTSAADFYTALAAVTTQAAGDNALDGDAYAEGGNAGLAKTGDYLGYLLVEGTAEGAGLFWTDDISTDGYTYEGTETPKVLKVWDSDFENSGVVKYATGPVPPPVPEPTSGLLLLLGVAGLALKRRRA